VRLAFTQKSLVELPFVFFTAASKVNLGIQYHSTKGRCSK